MASLRDIRKEDALLRVMRLIERIHNYLQNSLKGRNIERSGLLCFNGINKKGFVKLENFKNSPKKTKYA